VDGVGVATAIRAVVEHPTGRRDRGVRVFVRDAGHVGGALAREVAAVGAAILVADVEVWSATAFAREVGG
jgi:hypothetical protein